VPLTSFTEFTQRASASGFLPAVVLSVLLGFFAVPLRAGDWPQFGGNFSRNAVSDEKNIPEWFEPGKKKTDGSGVEMATTRNVKWIARIGTENYSSPTVAGGKVFIGTNDVNLTDSHYHSTGGGVLLCLDEATGKLLWRLVVPKTESTQHSSDYDAMQLGICSSPTVDGDRVYVVTNRSEVVCLDADGMQNGNQGPITDERHYTGELSDPETGRGADDADVIWRYDMMSELSIFPHDAASCSVLVFGDVVYVVTGNGVDDGKAPFPMSPTFIALDKHTGRLLAKDEESIGGRVFHGQWASPSFGQVGGKTLVFFGGGDGVCYAFDAIRSTGDFPQPGSLRKVWSCDANPREYRYGEDGKPRDYWDGDKREKKGNNNDGLYVGPSEIIGTPVFCKNRVYVAIGQDPLHGRGKGCVTCIDATKQGDVSSSGVLWTHKDLDRSLSTPVVYNGLVFVADMTGLIQCLDAETGQCYWKHDANSDCWSSPMVADGKVYLGTRRGLNVLAAAKEKKVYKEIKLGSQIRSTPAVSDGVLYVASQNYLWAVQKDAHKAGKIIASGGENSLPAKPPATR
jgi:outer membrane protein assembly factor BamB